MTSWRSTDRIWWTMWKGRVRTRYRNKFYSYSQNGKRYIGRPRKDIPRTNECATDRKIQNMKKKKTTLVSVITKLLYYNVICHNKHFWRGRFVKVLFPGKNGAAWVPLDKRFYLLLKYVSMQIYWYIRSTALVMHITWHLVNMLLTPCVLYREHTKVKHIMWLISCLRDYNV